MRVGGNMNSLLNFAIQQALEEQEQARILDALKKEKAIEQKIKEQPIVITCACGRRISANKYSCLACSRQK